MRRKIIAGFITFSILILASVFYSMFHMEKASSQLKDLVRSHQVEILRRNLLEKLEIVQFDFYLMNTRYAKEINTVVADVREMQSFADRCLGCHHPPEIERQLREVRRSIEDYKSKLSRFLTLRANRIRLQEEERSAYLQGQQLITMVNQMIAHASSRLAEKTQHSLKNIEKTKMILYILLLTGPILAVAFSLIMIPSITKPLNVLLNAIQLLKAGDLNFRIKAPLKGEFGEVASAFNEMTETLKQQMPKMQRAEQMVVCGQLAAGLAHEIKNPLAGIKAAIEVLSEEPTIGRENQDTLTKVVAEIRRIESSIKSLLEFARPPKPQFMRVDLKSLLESTLSFVTQQSPFSPNRSGSVEIVKDWNGHLPEVYADPQQLRQVFINLLLNANEAMPNGGTITLRINQDSLGWVEVSVSDTGKGISHDTLGRLFQPFFTTKPKGTGLGLAISKQLIEQHGGTIQAENIPCGGAEFKIKVPVASLERQTP